MQSDTDTHIEHETQGRGICMGEFWQWNSIMNDTKELIFHTGYKMSRPKDTSEL